jgi:hypothetical protein
MHIISGTEIMMMWKEKWILLSFPFLILQHNSTHPTPESFKVFKDASMAMWHGICAIRLKSVQKTLLIVYVIKQNMPHPPPPLDIAWSCLV